MSVPGRLGSVSEARHFIADLCRGWGLGDVSDTASLLVSETVTNSIVHGCSDVEMTVEFSPPTLRVGIADHDQHLPEQLRPSADRAGGRGLALVDALADSWGVVPEVDGKTVWFRLGSHPENSPEEAAHPEFAHPEFAHPEV